MQACSQLMQIKGFDQIIVCTGLQTFNALTHRVACGQHQHGQLKPLTAPACQQVQAVLIGQAQVQHAHIKVR